MDRCRSLVAAVAVGAAALGCGGGAAPEPEVTRVESTGMVPGPGPLGVMDDALVGLRTFRSPEPDHVVVSHDRGRTWSAADLPGRPEGVLLGEMPLGLYADDGLAAVVGRDPEPASSSLPIAKAQFLVWTTTDGATWTRHVLDTTAGIVGAPTVTAVGPLLLASTSTIEGFDLFTSRDHGSSWRQAEVSGLDQQPGEGLTLEAASAEDDTLRMVVDDQLGGGPDRRQILRSGDGGTTWSAEPCGPGCPDGGGVIHRFGETSTDGGETWHQIDVEPAPPGDSPVFLSTLQEVDGGWLASASTTVIEHVNYAMLLRSDDGRSWRQLLPPDPCAGEDVDSTSSVGDPVRFDGRWYATYDCSDADRVRIQLGVVYVGDEDGREFEAIEATERSDVTFGDPLVAADRLLVPEFDLDDLVAVTTIG